MNKTIKIIVSGLIAIPVCYFVIFIFEFLVYSHSIDWERCKQYTWIFRDSIKTDIDPNICGSYVKRRDIYNSYLYKRTYSIIVWEFKDLDLAKLNKTAVYENVDLDDVKFSSGEILNRHSDPEITIKYGFSFKNTMNVNLDKYSHLEKSIIGSNYKGFYGTINEMSLSDENGRHFIIFDYQSAKEPTLFLFYKGHHGFFVIVINSKIPFDERIIKILNLP